MMREGRGVNLEPAPRPHMPWARKGDAGGTFWPIRVGGFENVLK